VLVGSAAAAILLQTVLAQAPKKDLATAVQAGASKQALEMIQSGADVNQAQGDGSTPLIWAVNRQDYDVAQALLAKKANPNAVNEFGAMPLTEAVRLNDDRLVKMLLDAGAKVDSANPDDESALMLAIKNGNLQMAETLVKAGANVNRIEKFHNETPLIYAAAGGHAAIVKLLLSKDASVKPRSLYTDWPSQVTSEPRTQYRSVGGLNPLMYAIRGGCYSCVDLLLAAGADVNFPTPEGITPLMLALDNEHNEIANFLMDKGAYLDVWDWWGRTPLWIAVDRKVPPGGPAGGGFGGFGGARGGGAGAGGAGFGAAGPGGGRGGAGRGRAGAQAERDPNAPPPVSSMQIINRLLAAGVDVNPEMNFHRPNAPNRGRFADNQVSTRTTPLFRAVQLNDLDVVEVLLNKGADPNINTMGYTPFGLAAGNGPNGRGTPGQAVNPLMMDLLAKHGADVNARISGTLSFSFHTGYGNTNDGVNSKEGTSALHEAARTGQLDLVKHLLDLGADPNLKDGEGMKPVDVIGKSRAAATAPAAGRGGGRGRGPSGPNEATLTEIRSLLESASANATAARR
jgi:ankyrin repeat protein